MFGSSMLQENEVKEKDDKTVAGTIAFNSRNTLELYADRLMLGQLSSCAPIGKEGESGYRVRIAPCHWFMPTN